jgi:MscS family membrane protein
VCTVSLLVLRFALRPAARQLFFWWTDSTSDKAWVTSALYWVILNVYGPLELALVTVAGMRFVEAGIERYGLIQPQLLNAVVERLVVGALVVAFSRVALSWQERYFSQKTFDLELAGKPLQAERLAGLNKLSNIATYLVATALGLKVLDMNNP